MTECNHILRSEEGSLTYYENFFLKQDCEFYFNKLMDSIPWKNDVIKLFGKRIVTNRKVAWFAENNITYTYSNQQKTANPFFYELQLIKEKVEVISNCEFNSCLLNLYMNGKDGMGWHSDNEKEIEVNSTIASVSFGASRKIYFKNRMNPLQKLKLQLAPGSLLLMEGKIQKHWLHSIPKMITITEPRINLTFRKMKLT